MKGAPEQGSMSSRRLKETAFAVFTSTHCVTAKAKDSEMTPWWGGAGALPWESRKSPLLQNPPLPPGSLRALMWGQAPAPSGTHLSPEFLIPQPTLQRTSGLLPCRFARQPRCASILTADIAEARGAAPASSSPLPFKHECESNIIFNTRNCLQQMLPEKEAESLWGGAEGD